MAAEYTMPDTVLVSFEVDPETATALQDPSTHARVERLIQRTVKPATVARLFELMDSIGAEASQRGLTDDILNAELAAYNAELREPDRSTPT